jgi:hypothetical protein
MQAPGHKDEDCDEGFEHGGWTLLYWHDDIGKSFGELMRDADALLLGRRTYMIHAQAQAFEPLPAGDPFGDMMNAPEKYVGLADTRKADLAQHDYHPRQCSRIGAYGVHRTFTLKSATPYPSGVVDLYCARQSG